MGQPSLLYSWNPDTHGNRRKDEALQSIQQPAIATIEPEARTTSSSEVDALPDDAPGQGVNDQRTTSAPSLRSAP